MMLGLSAARARNAAKKITMQATDRMKPKLSDAGTASQTETECTGARASRSAAIHDSTCACDYPLSNRAQASTSTAAGEDARAPALRISPDCLASKPVCEC